MDQKKVKNPWLRLKSCRKSYTVHFGELLSKNLFWNVEKIWIWRPMVWRRVFRGRIVKRVGHDEGGRGRVTAVSHRRRRLKYERRRTVRRRHPWTEASCWTVGLKESKWNAKWCTKQYSNIHTAQPQVLSFKCSIKQKWTRNINSSKCIPYTNS